MNDRLRMADLEVDIQTEMNSVLKKSTEKATSTGIKSSSSRVATTIKCLAANFQIGKMPMVTTQYVAGKSVYNIL